MRCDCLPFSLLLVATTLTSSTGFLLHVGNLPRSQITPTSLAQWQVAHKREFHTTGVSSLCASQNTRDESRGRTASPLGASVSVEVAMLETRVKALELELSAAKVDLAAATRKSQDGAAQIRSRSLSPPGGTASDPSGVQFQIKDLIRVVDALVSEEGCPWTATQGALDIVMHAQSELREIKEELRSVRPERHGLVSELGDLLFNTILLVKVCERDNIGGVTLAGCAAFASAKVQRRAPFVFTAEGSQTHTLSAEEASLMWKTVKEQEKAGLVAVCPSGWEYDDDKEACVLIVPSAEMAAQSRQRLADLEAAAVGGSRPSSTTKERKDSATGSTDTNERTGWGGDKPVSSHEHPHPPRVRSLSPAYLTTEGKKAARKEQEAKVGKRERAKQVLAAMISIWNGKEPRK